MQRLHKHRDIRPSSRNLLRSGALNIIQVRAKPLSKTEGLLVANNLVLPCAVGKGGISAFKREGDGATPLASMQLLYGYYRADRIRLPATMLPMHPIRKSDGWCDTPGDANYNRLVRLPYPAGHEKMWRDDGLYDLCIVMEWNISPRKRGCGSAIFFHLAKPGYKPTEGCIALSRENMMRLLPSLSRDTRIEVLR